MTNKIFPIKSDKACLLKWNWSTVHLNSGTSSSCHRTQKYAIDPENFSQFHNLPEKIKARQLMLEGTWPGHGCESCKNVEDVGGMSDRLYQLDQLQDPEHVPPELFDDPTAVNVTPTIVEVYFNNTCNMSCIYCGPFFSSRWEDENNKYGSPHKIVDDKYSHTISQKNPHYEKMSQEFWNYLKKDNNAKKIRRFHVLGGEPLLLKELDQVIAFWAQYGHPDLIITIVSNLNIPHERFKKYIKKFELLAKNNKIWRLQITGSLDGWGPEQEYVRYGLDLELWQKNFEYLLNKSWIYPAINTVVSALTIRTLPKLMKNIDEWNIGQNDIVDEWRSFSNKILYSCNASYTYDSPFIFSGDIFDSFFQEAINLMPTDTFLQQGHKQTMTGIAIQSCACVSDPLKINQLKDYLDLLDQRRGTNWRNTFPWLEQIKT